MQHLISLMSFFHILSASLSLLLGAVILFATKGNINHRRMGMIYFYAMIINNVTSLFIYRSGIFFFPHWLAIITLVVLIPGFIITRFKGFRHWLKVHIISLLFSYYMLVGGAINEAFLRIQSLKYLMGTPTFGMIHFAAQLIFLGLITFFLLKYRNKKALAL